MEDRIEHRPRPGDPVKITRPKASRLLERSRLFAALDDARHSPVVWISAPPGFGKTSLGGSYVERRALECVWYRLDDEDADIGNFFRYLRIAGERFSAAADDLPGFAPDDLPSLRAFSRRFFERLYARIGGPAVVVLDDYQSLPPESEVHGLLADAAERLPADIQFIFLSREQPPPAFARLRAHAGVSELAGDLLRFTPNEAAALASRSDARDASPERIAALNTFAEGWAAGLTLLLERGDLPLPERAPGPAVLEVLFDYFSQEIFGRLTPSVRTLLLECALLPEMEERAVQQLTDDENSARLLSELSAKSYFTTRHEGETTAYRFHPLFRTFLRNRAQSALTPERLGELQKRAAEILLGRGDLEDGVSLLRECEDWPALVQVVLRNADELARQGRFKTLAAWIGALPRDTVDESPWLLFWLGSCKLPFEPVEARAPLLRAYQRFESADDATGLYLCWSGIATLYFFAVFSSEHAVAWISVFETLQRAHPRFPSAAVEARVAVSIVSLLRLYRLDHPKLPYWVDRCRALLNVMEDRSMRLMAVNELGWCYSWLGKTAQGVLLVRETAHLAAPDAPPLARLSWLMASVIYAWHRADDREGGECVKEALRIADENDVHVMNAYICTLGTYGALTVGDIAAAEALKARLDAAPGEAARLSIDASAFYHVHTLVNLQAGRFDAAAEYAREAQNQVREFQVTFLRFLTPLCLGSCLLELGELDEAEAHLEAGYAWVEAMDSDVMVHLYLLAKALLELKRGRLRQALDLLGSALRRANSAGGHYTPFFFRPSLAELYAEGLSAGVETALVQNQIRRQRLAPPTPIAAPDAWPWPIKIYTLGRFAISKDGTAIKTGAKASRKPVQLLKTLIASGGRDVHQNTLIAELWPEADGDDAHHAFETTLYRLRKFLGAGAVAVKNGSVALEAGHCWVDCWMLERMLSSVDEAIAANDATRVNDETRRALSLYRGPFLDLDQEIALAARHRERLRSRLLRSLEKLGAYWTKRNEPDNAADCYLQALEVEPCAEGLYRRLMRHYLAQHRHAEAIAVFERCRRVLQSLLGLEPSAKTRAVHAAVLKAAGSQHRPKIEPGTSAD